MTLEQQPMKGITMTIKVLVIATVLSAGTVVVWSGPPASVPATQPAVPASRPTSAEEIKKLIAQLGDKDFKVRDAASKRLTDIGEPAKLALSEYIKTEKDPEIVARMKQILAALEKSIKVARLRYGGNFDPEPLALERLSKLMPKQFDLKIDIAQLPGKQQKAGVAPSELTADIKIVFMTGTGAFKLTEQDEQDLKTWLDGGGLLVADAAGGSKAFSDCFKALADKLWGGDALKPLPLSNPLYRLSGLEIKKVKYRNPTKLRTGGIREPRLEAILAGDKPKVIFSQEDITCGLMERTGDDIDGYEPESACSLMRNIIMYAATK